MRGLGAFEPVGGRAIAGDFGGPESGGGPAG